MKAKPGQVSVGSAGVNSSGYTAIAGFTRALGVTYKHVSYDGGNPAVIATVSGETEVTTQLAVEQAQMIRGKRLRPLAVLSDRRWSLKASATSSRSPRPSRASSLTPITSASSCLKVYRRPC